jgi:CelD/BcsL family acetyltransferase involved in cellulose biosynthesis
MTVTVYREPSVFEALAEEWNALVDSNPATPPFLRCEWLRLWWRIVGRGDLWVLAARDEAGALIGLAPLYLDVGEDGARVLRQVGHGPPFYMEISDYLDLPVAPGREGAFYAALLDALAGAAPGVAVPAWDRVEIYNLGEWSPLPAGLQVHATTRGLTVEKSPVTVCPVITLPSSFDAYLETLDSKQRREIKRKLRRATGENKVAWYIVGPDRDIEAEAQAFVEMMAISGKGKEDFLIPQMREMFVEGMGAAQAGGWLQLAFLEVNGRKAAAYLNFDYHDRIWVFNSAIDVDASGTISTGWVLLAYLIEWAIQNGRECYDFLRGDEDYKLRFGGVPTPIYRLIIKRLGE